MPESLCEVEWIENFRTTHDVSDPSGVSFSQNVNTLDGLHLRLAGSARLGSDRNVVSSSS